jgi:prepilin-type processing-associated H-X9-DG protein
MYRNTRRGRTLLDVVVVLVILVALFALLMPTMNRGRVRARGSQCKRNLKQLGLALHNYHDVNSTFPPGWVAVRPPEDAIESRGAYGWGTRILPYMDQQPLFRQINFNEPFGSDTIEGDAQQHVVSRSLPGYQCPNDSDAHPSAAGPGPTSYVGNFGVGLPSGFGPLNHPDRGWYVHGIFGCNTNVSMKYITDGISNTVLVGERRLPAKGRDWPEHGVEGSFNSYWSGIPKVGTVSPLSLVATVTSGDVADMSLLNRVGVPTGLGTAEQPGALAVFGINVTADGEPLGESQRVSPGFSSRHPQGCHILLADGSVKFVSESIDRRVLVNLMRRADGVPPGEF